jgi:hypothetical protein
MARQFILEPEVAGGLGADTAMDSSVHPPMVSALHYEFEGWLGDDLLETFPCFIVTERLKSALEDAGSTGCSFAPVKVTVSDSFAECYPDRALPQFYWLRVTGTPEKDDFSLASDHRLLVSDEALDVLRAFTIEHCEVLPWP